MKVLLVKSHSYSGAKGIGAPIGLGYIASFLMGAGHEVYIEDLMLTEVEKAEEVFRARVARLSPDIVGITCNSHERFFAFDVAVMSPFKTSSD